MLTIEGRLEILHNINQGADLSCQPNQADTTQGAYPLQQIGVKDYGITGH